MGLKDRFGEPEPEYVRGRDFYVTIKSVFKTYRYLTSL